MRFRSTSLIPLFLLLGSAAALLAAYIAQYGFGLKPCHLCLYQRIPYGVVIVLALLSFIASRYYKIITIIAIISLLIGAGVAFYHMGVEYKWFAGLDSCSGQVGAAPKTLEEMRAELIGTKAVRCDTPAFVFLGLSMAGWNMLYALLLSAGALVLFWRERKYGG